MKTPSDLRGKIGMNLSIAHRAIYWARAHASDIGQESLEQDLYLLEQEIIRLQTGMFKGRAKPRVPGPQVQLTISDAD